MEDLPPPLHVRHRANGAFVFRRWAPIELVPYVRITDGMVRTGKGLEWFVTLGNAKSWPDLIRRDPGAYVRYLWVVGESDAVLVQALRDWLDDHPEPPQRLRGVTVGKLAKSARRAARCKAKPTARPMPSFMITELKAWHRDMRRIAELIERAAERGARVPEYEKVVTTPVLWRAFREWEEEQEEQEAPRSFTPREIAAARDFFGFMAARLKESPAFQNAKRRRKKERG
jgi:hypothetical protein